LWAGVKTGEKERKRSFRASSMTRLLKADRPAQESRPDSRLVHGGKYTRKVGIKSVLKTLRGRDQRKSESEARRRRASALIGQTV
jgi:hypothetical protein